MEVGRRPGGRATAALDRVSWVEIRFEAGQACCRLHGTRRRRPCTVPLDLATALALEAGGVPTLVSRRRGA